MSKTTKINTKNKPDLYNCPPLSILTIIATAIANIKIRIVAICGFFLVNVFNDFNDFNDLDIKNITP